MLDAPLSKGTTILLKQLIGLFNIDADYLLSNVMDFMQRSAIIIKGMDMRLSEIERRQNEILAKLDQALERKNHDLTH